jgi:hypothetical protein
MVAAFTPQEDLNRITRLTAQSLFYKSKGKLKRKLMVIEEDEGMRDALFAIRVLLSSQRLHLQSLKHDQKSGELIEFENVVEGPAAIFIATTDPAAFDHETLNRFFVLYLDESSQETRSIMEMQDKMDTLEGVAIKQRKEQIVTLHQNIQRMLKPLLVVNPYGTKVNYPPEILHSRREKTKLQLLIKATALLHQYQREVKETVVLDSKVKYIEVHQSDIDTVLSIAGDILRHSLDDLSKLCRELLKSIHALVDEKLLQVKALPRDSREAVPEYWQITFTRKELLERSGWSMWHLREHLRELAEHGYIAPRTGKRGQQFAYSLVEDTFPELPDIGMTMQL